MNDYHGHEFVSFFLRFQYGQKDVEGDTRPGRLSTSKTDENIAFLIFVWSCTFTGFQKIKPLINITILRFLLNSVK